MGKKSSSEIELTPLVPNPRAIPYPLQFYDPEIQIAINTEPFDKPRMERAYRKAEVLRQAYLEQLQPLRFRLALPTYRRLSNPRKPLFDSNLISFSVGDAVGGIREGRRWKGIPSALAKFLSFDQKTIHTLRFSGLDHMSCNLPQYRWFSWSSGSREFDSLIHDELTPYKDQLMRHRFLFSSGAAIDIVFARMVWSATRVNRTKH